MNINIPTIAIVGRPNVGKSALFNKLVGRRISIVHDFSGVTRDRIVAVCHWDSRALTIIDTGGIGLLRGEKTEDPIVAAAFVQVNLAIESADIILFVVNIREGVVALDKEVATLLRKCGKKVIVAVNKADTQDVAENVDEFSQLGFDLVIPVSAVHGRGIDDLMDATTSLLPPVEPKPAVAEGTTPALAVIPPPQYKPIKLAVVGRPNVGKSSIINSLTRSERVIVSEIPGTTRDSVDIPFSVTMENSVQDYLLIDTAGIRKERRIHDTLELFSIQRTEESILRSDIVLFVLDATSGILEQDKKIADKIVEARKACIIIINKWDLTTAELKEIKKKNQDEINAPDARKHKREPTLTTLPEFAGWVQDKLFFLDYAPVLFTSAVTGFNMDRMFEYIQQVNSYLQQKIGTSLLNRTLQAAIEKRQPVSAQGHVLKFYYATQIQQAPPRFLLFVNRNELFSTQYVKYLANELRQSFGYEGCPVLIEAKPRPKTVLSIRRHGNNQHRPDSNKPHRGNQRHDRGERTTHTSRPQQKPAPSKFANATEKQAPSKFAPGSQKPAPSKFTDATQKPAPSKFAHGAHKPASSKFARGAQKRTFSKPTRGTQKPALSKSARSAQKQRVSRR